MPGISVIIPTFQRPDILPETLLRLSRQTAGPKTLEVIVIDDDSNPEIRTLVESYHDIFNSVVYLSQKNEGQSKARNQAIKQATAPLLFMMGDDILLEPDVLALHQAFHVAAAHDNVAIFGRIEVDPRLNQNLFVQWLNNGGPQNSFFLLNQKGYIGPDRVETAHLSLPTRYARRVSFDPRLRYFENYLWAQDLFQTGFLFYYLPEAVSYHYHPCDLDQYANRIKGIGSTMALLASEKRPWFVNAVKSARPIGRMRLLRYHLLANILGIRKYQSKYWDLYLKKCLYQACRKAP